MDKYQKPLAELLKESEAELLVRRARMQNNPWAAPSGFDGRDYDGNPMPQKIWDQLSRFGKMAAGRTPANNEQLLKRYKLDSTYANQDAEHAIYAYQDILNNIARTMRASGIGLYQEERRLNPPPNIDPKKLQNLLLNWSKG